jgi:hypothetical protein
MTKIKFSTVFIAGCLAALSLADTPAWGESPEENNAASGSTAVPRAAKLLGAPADAPADLGLAGEALGRESLGRIAGGAHQVAPPPPQRFLVTIKLWDEGRAQQNTTVMQGTGQINTSISVQQFR